MLELKEKTKKKRKYSLNNSYFKNRFQDDPANPFEVLEYFKENGELPYEGEIDPETWFYECFVEYQKRKGVELSQFFTPPKTAKRMAKLLDELQDGTDPYILDACSGYGQLSMACKKRGFIVRGFDLERDFEEPYRYFSGGQFKEANFNKYQNAIPEFSLFFKTYKNIISNPPYEQLTDFFQFLNKTLEFEGIAVLLLPTGAWDKGKPKAFVELKKNFELIYRENMTESFARTGVKAEIIVLRKITEFKEKPKVNSFVQLKLEGSDEHN